MRRFHINQWINKLPKIMAVILLINLSSNLVDAQQLPEEARIVVRTWLLNNCVVGQEGRLEGELVKWGLRLEPVFIEALERGPNEKLITELESLAAVNFKRRQESIKTGEGLGLSQADLEAARKVTRDQFIAREKEDFVLRYKSQALLGLGIVGGDKAEDVLRQIARDDKSPLKSSAEQALHKLLKR